MGNRKPTLGEVQWTKEHRAVLHLLYTLWTFWEDGNQDDLQNIFYRMYPIFQRRRYTSHIRDDWTQRWSERKEPMHVREIDRPNKFNTDPYTSDELAYFANLRVLIEAWARSLNITLNRRTPANDWTDERREQHRLLLNATPNQDAVTAMRPGDTHSSELMQQLRTITKAKPGMPVDGLSLPNTIGENNVKSPPRPPKKQRDGSKKGKKAVYKDSTQQDTPGATSVNDGEASSGRRRRRNTSSPRSNSSPTQRPKKTARRSTTRRGCRASDNSSEDDSEFLNSPHPQNFTATVSDEVEESDYFKLEMLHRSDVRFLDHGIEVSDSALRNAAFVNHDTAVYQSGGWVFNLHLNEETNDIVADPIIQPVMVCNDVICAHCSRSAAVNGSLGLYMVRRFPERRRLPLVHRRDLTTSDGGTMFDKQKQARYQNGRYPDGNVQDVMFDITMEGGNVMEKVCNVRICIRGECDECDGADGLGAFASASKSGGDEDGGYDLTAARARASAGGKEEDLYG